MTNLEAIQARTSRRTYLSTPIEAVKVAELNLLIDQYNATGDLNMFLLLNGSAVFSSLTKSYGLFKGVNAVFVLKGPEGNPNLKEKLGYYGELLVLEATKLGLGTCWVGGTFDHNHKLLQVAEGERLVSVITVGYVPLEQTLKEKMIFNAVHRKTKSLAALYESDIPTPEWFLAALLAVQIAPSAMNSQKVTFQLTDEEDESVVTATVPDNYAADMIDLGIAKLHFEIAVNEAPGGLRGKFKWGNPGILKNDSED